MSARRSSLKTPVELIFKNADGDGDGCLSIAEFTMALRSLHLAIPEDEAQQLREFLGEVGEEDIREIFSEINKSKSGKITWEEFKGCEFFEDDD